MKPIMDLGEEEKEGGGKRRRAAKDRLFSTVNNQVFRQLY